MRAAVWTETDRIEVRTMPLPALPPNSVLVKVELTGLCGTDFAILHGAHPRAVAPLVLGHEILGIVADGSPDGPPVGTRVTVEPLISCGRCGPCRSNSTHVCQNLRLYGIDAPGSLAEYVALPASSLIAIDPAVPSVEAAMAEPLAVAVHAVHRSGLRGGESVLIFGAGPIGILTALVARQAGAGLIVVVEPSKARRGIAEALGFVTVAEGIEPRQAVNDLTSGAGADIVFDSAAHPSVAGQLASVVRVLGTIVVVGVYKSPAEVDLQSITFKEITVVGVRVYTRADVEEAVSLIESGALGLGRLPVEVFPLEQVAEAFERAMAASRTLKVFVECGRSAAE